VLQFDRQSERRFILQHFQSVMTSAWPPPSETIQGNELAEEGGAHPVNNHAPGSKAGKGGEAGIGFVLERRRTFLA